MSLRCVTIAVIILLGGATPQSDRYQATLANIPEDGLLNFTQLAEKYRHPAIAYDITTEDGYILAVYNLPGDRKRPVLLVHGIFDSGDGWIIRGNTSLAIILADEGYDVWALNFRGNRYSRRHKTLDPDKDSQFWDFSAHEYGYYDLPASVDLVLDVTRQTQLTIVGYSEGTTSAFILASTRSEYNDKIKLFIGLAPIAFLSHAGPVLSVIIQLSPLINFILPLQEVIRYYSLMKAILNLVCTQLVIGYELCYQGGFSPLSGTDPIGIERDFFPVVIGHYPAGTSKKNLLHYAQIGLRGVFAQYDYGTSKNLQMYHSFTPPSYDLSKVKMRTVLVSGKNDAVSTFEDVAELRSKLPNVVKYKVLERETFNHLDHLWAFDAYRIEYPFILDTLNHNK